MVTMVGKNLLFNNWSEFKDKLLQLFGDIRNIRNVSANGNVQTQEYC